MRIILLITFLACVVIKAEAQKDYCKEIKKTVKELESETDFESPHSGSNYIFLSKAVKGPVQSNQLVIVIKDANSNYTAKGVYLKLSDGSLLNDENAAVDDELEKAIIADLASKK